MKNSGSSIGVCTKVILDLISGLENSGNSIGVCSKVVLYLMSGLKNSGNSIGVCTKVILDLMSGLENSGNSIGVCSKVVLDLMSGLKNSGNSIGVCTKVILDLMSGLENSGNSIGVCSKGVLDLMSGLENRVFRLYSDNYYSSPTFYQHLCNGVTACGTASPNRVRVPMELIKKATKLNDGFIDYHSSGPPLASVWMGKCTIYFLSTLEVAEPPTRLHIQ